MIHTLTLSLSIERERELKFMVSPLATCGKELERGGNYPSIRH